MQEPPFHLSNRLLQYKGRLVIGKNEGLWNQLLYQYHNSAIWGHSSIKATYERAKQYFYCPNMKNKSSSGFNSVTLVDVTKLKRFPFWDSCSHCPLPSQAWNHISMDFIEQLLTSKNKDTILLVVNRFTKCGPFLSLRHPFTDQEVDLFAWRLFTNYMEYHML